MAVKPIVAYLGVNFWLVTRDNLMVLPGLFVTYGWLVTLGTLMVLSAGWFG